MDDDQSQPARPLRLWAWLVVVMALAGCAAVDGLPVGRGDAWGIAQRGGLLLLLLSLLIYGICMFRSAGVYHRLFSLRGRNPVLTAVVVIGLGVPLALMGWTAFVSVADQCRPTVYQDHWPSLALVIGSAALVELAGASRFLATPNLRFTLRGLLVTTLLVAMIAGAVRFLVQRQQEQMQARVNLPILLELSRLETALKTHHAYYGDWPPQSPQGFERYVRCSFPRARNWRADLAAAGLDPDTMDAEEALVFWLGGMPDPNDPKRPAGFSRHAERPFGPSAPRTGPLFEFDPRRLVDADGDGWLEYRSRDRYGATQPKVYRLEGKTVVAVEYSSGGTERVPMSIYRVGNEGLEVSAPAQDAPPPEQP